MTNVGLHNTQINTHVLRQTAAYSIFPRVDVFDGHSEHMFFRRSWSFLLNIMKPQQPPLVVVLGATGAGKSKLAIDIAKQFNGEVINADSLQVHVLFILVFFRV